MAGIEAEYKLSKFAQDIKDEIYFKVKLLSLFTTEYEEIISDILNLNENLFIDQVKEGVSLVLEDKYTAYCLSESLVINLISKNVEDIRNKYKQDFYLINNAWNNYEKSSKKKTVNNFFLSGFRKHCINTEEYLSHNCLSKENDGEKKCHFITVYNNNNNNDIKFVICEHCKKVYYASFILARCYKCKVDYYTSLLYPEENPEMLLATWENYHCPQLINEKMKCINCHEYFYINMKNGLLTCLNKKCAFISMSNRILWTCCTCNKEFKSGAIPYNPLDIQVTKKLVIQTLLLKHKAHPKKMACGCKLNVFFTDFFHSNKCEGILYESELDDNTIIVCDKCKMITYIDRFIWTCPKCKKKFKKGIGDLIIINEDENENSEEILVEENNNKNKSNDKIIKQSPNNKHLNYASKRLKNYKLKQEKKINEEKSNNNEEIKELKDNKKNEVINGGWKHRRYSKNHPKSSQDVVSYVDKEKEKADDNKEKNDKEEDNNSNDNNVLVNNGEKKPEEKKSYRRFGYLENRHQRIKTDFEDLYKDKIDEKQKEKEIDIEEKNQQRYVSQRNMWKKRLFHLYNNNKQDKGEKEEKDEKEKINIKSNIKNNLEKQEQEPEQTNNKNKKNQKLSPESKKEKLKESHNLSKENNNKSPKSKEASIDFEASPEKSLSDLDLNQEEEELEENNNSPRYKRQDLIKKKTVGIILGETEDDKGLESPRKRKKKNAPQIQVKIAMSKIPGVSEHLFNHINKRMTSILNRCKIPLFNIDDYVFNKKLGEGGCAVIFSVFKKDDEEQKQFALKKIIAKTLTEIDKFTKEFEIMHNCIHENIMKIYGICIRILDQTTYALYVLMELSEGDWDKEIKYHLSKKKYYSEKKLINILRQLTSALLFMQKKAKVSHRDIKPQNVLLFNGTYKIADFGEAKMANMNSEINTLRGTELFMSPVLYSGLKHDKNDVNHDPYKSDVFSLGFCFLYAATLNFDLLHKVRVIYNSNMMNEILEQNLRDKYSKVFIYILSRMLDTDENERFNFEQLVQFVNDKYDQEGNLKEGNDINNININNNDKLNDNKGKKSPVNNRKKNKK